ncbi:hypothetical protein BN2497_2123 [Janthinobacterium sp. CG23_2]|nr:hypothetical protein BN2497_2123 [Janthinobacterium sp. CG23_2]CUU27459.1 hypothetical protein BN3177_2123 [Janthinobacterium sp. CG23_2]
MVLTAEQEFALLDASEPDQVDAQLKKNIRTFTSACLCLNGMTSSVSIRQLQNDTAFVPSTN